MKRLLLGLGCGLVLGVAAVAVLRPARAAPGAAAAVPQSQPAPHEETANLEVRVTPEMQRYSNMRYALYFAGALIQAAVLLFILRSRLSARLRDLAERVTPIRFVQALVYYPLFTLLYGLLLLPLALYSGFLLPHQYGLSTQSLTGWLVDGLKGFAVSCAVGSPVVALLYWTLRRSPRRWWLAFWFASIPLIVFAVLLAPLVVDPIFNRFEPLKDAALREKILALASRAGIERGRVFQVDASRRTNSVNAYVTGLGGSARIVLWDTTLRKLNQPEILAVMTHEMGHYKEGHVLIGTALSIFGTLLVLLLTDRGARLALDRNGQGWGVRGLDDLASLPLLLLLLALLNFFGSPVSSAASRVMESRADEFSLRMTDDGRAAASSFIKLAELNLSNPDPPKFVELWMFTHPTLRQRIDRALAWDRSHGRE